MSEEKLLDAYSAVNDDGVPYLGTCTLIVGDGTQKVDFRNGRAKVPASFAHLVARHQHVEIPFLGAVQEPDEDEVDDEVLDYQSLPVAALKALASERGVTVQGKATKPKLVAALEAADTPEETPDETPDDTSGETSEEKPATGELSEEVKAAIEHLQAEGEEIPEIEVADEPELREGFERVTADGEARCQAAKVDGSQCSNAAVDGSRACRLGKHQEQTA